MAATLSSSSSCNLLHRLRRPQSPSLPTPPPLLSHFLKPLFPSAYSTSTAKSTAFAVPSSSPKSTVGFQDLNPLRLFFTPVPSVRRLSCPFCVAAFSQTPLHHREVDNDRNPNGAMFDEDDDLDEDDNRVEVLEEKEQEEREPGTAVGAQRMRPTVKVPALSVKEKKDLASYAHSLGTKLKSQSVGKSGVNDSVAASFIETLEANELLKIKIHRTCPGEFVDVVKQLEVATGSVVVGQIGRTIIIYRPSLTKMKAEEKKKQAQRVFVRRAPKANPVLLKEGQYSRLSSRGRHGSSRF